MVFSANEKGLMNYSLVYSQEKNHQGQIFPQNYNLNELPTALAVRKNLVKDAKDEKFIESDCEFTSEEKVFLSKRLNRAWSMDDGIIALELIEKLKK